MQGLKEAKTAYKTFEESQKRGTVNQFYLNPDEPTLIWLIGSAETDPFIYHAHSVALADRFTKIVCNQDENGDGRCVGCYYASQKSQKIKSRSLCAALSVVALMPQHKVLDEARTQKAGREKYSFTKCTQDLKCVGCSKRWEVIPPETTGVRLWKDIAITHINNLSTLNDTLRGKCRCGGKLKLVAYLDPQTGREYKQISDDFDLSAFEEVHQCNKCQDPMPLDVFSVALMVTKSGSGTSTTYTFTPEYDVERPDWLENVHALDLTTICGPQPTALQARIAQVKDPFSAVAPTAGRPAPMVRVGGKSVPAKVVAEAYDTNNDDIFG